MPRRRRTPGPSRNLGPQQNPRNLGQNRVASVRANNRGQNTYSPNQAFQGGVGQGPPVTPGARPPVSPQPQSGAPGGTAQCPTGQRPGRTADGRMGCVPVKRAGAPGVSPARGSGAGIPNRSPRPKNVEGY